MDQVGLQNNKASVKVKLQASNGFYMNFSFFTESNSIFSVCTHDTTNVLSRVSTSVNKTQKLSSFTVVAAVVFNLAAYG